MSLSTKMMKQVKFYNRCKQDPVFFIEHCVTVPQVGGYKLVKLYDPQKEVVEDFIKHHYIIMNKSRQTGGSYIVQAICAWLMIFFDNYIVGVISRSGDESSSFNQKVLSIMDNIPQKFIRPHETLDYVYRNVKSFQLKSTGSKLISQAVSKENPEGVLRGNSLVTLIIDEAAFIKNIDIAFTGIMPATSVAQEMARDQGIPYGNFIISTPNGTRGIGDWYFRMWSNAIKKDSIYIPRSIHWRKTNRTEEWYKTQCAVLGNDPKRIAQEMEMQFISSEGSVWSDVIQMALNNIINANEEKEIPYKTIKFINYNGSLTLFNPNPDYNKFYLIGVDTASASGSDYSVIEVFDYESMEQIAEFVGKLEPKKYAEVVKKISNMFINNMIIVENTGGYGLTVLNELQFDPDSRFEIYGEMNKSENNAKFIAGLSNNMRTRPLIIEALYNYVNDYHHCIKSSYLASELLSLTENKNGKITAESGCNDDSAMAMGFLLYVRQYRPELLLHKTYELSKDSDAKYTFDIAETFVNDIYSYNPKHIDTKANVLYKYGFSKDEVTNIILKNKIDDNTKDKYIEKTTEIDMLDTDFFKPIG